jgi:hypothetical protein
MGCAYHVGSPAPRRSVPYIFRHISTRVPLELGRNATAVALLTCGCKRRSARRRIIQPNLCGCSIVGALEQSGVEITEDGVRLLRRPH